MPISPSMNSTFLASSLTKGPSCNLDSIIAGVQVVVVISTEDLFFRLQEHPDVAKIIERVVRLDERIRRKHGELAKFQVRMASGTTTLQETIDTLDSLSDELCRLEDERQSLIQEYLSGE